MLVEAFYESEDYQTPFLQLCHAYSVSGMSSYRYSMQDMLHE